MAGTTILSGSLITNDPFSFSHQPTAPQTIHAIIEAVKSHFSSDESATLTRHSVLLIYSLYSLLMDSDRYRDKFLLPLIDPKGLDHGFMGVGDIAISDKNGGLFECIQIVRECITPALVEESFSRVLLHAPKRFCLMATAEPYAENTQAILCSTDTIYQNYGCEIIVDSIMPTLNYFLRLLTNPADSLAVYSQALQEDTWQK